MVGEKVIPSEAGWLKWRREILYYAAKGFKITSVKKGGRKTKERVGREEISWGVIPKARISHYL